MKLAAIKKLCMAKKQFVIVNAPDKRQWLSDGSNAYPVDGVRIYEHSIPGLFDLTEKQANKLKIRSVELIDERMSVEPIENEKKLESMGVVWYSGDLYRVLGSEDGLVFVSVSCLKPAENANGFCRFTERMNADGNVVIAVFSDLLVSGIVSPVTSESAKAILAMICGISLQDVRSFTDPNAEEAADKAEKEAEKAIRRAQQMEMDEPDEGDADEAPDGDGA